MRTLANKILEKLNSGREDSALFNKEEDNHYSLTRESFKEIEKNDSGKKIGFVDGGNCEILKAPSFSLFFNRIYSTIYESNRREKNSICEFYSLISLEVENDEIYFKTEYEFIRNKIELKESRFSSFDKTLTQGNNRAKLSSIGNVIRRFAEIVFASSLNSPIIVIDGSLEKNFTFEEEYLSRLFSGNRVVCGLSKTNELITKKGNSLGAHLLKISEKKTWHCKVSSFDNFDVYFVKLSPHSEYTFRLDVSNNINYNIDEILSLLSDNSKDPVFYGYPYGLIEADRFARVSNKEKENLLSRVMSDFGKEYTKLLPYINSLNAHDILDKLN